MMNMETSTGDVCLRCKNGAAVEATGKQADGGYGGIGNRKNGNETITARAAHVLVFPFPLQGHINSMLRLSELLCLSGIEHVTFINTHRSHRLLTASNRDMSRRHHPGIRFRPISDGLPDDDDDDAGPYPAGRLRELHQSLAVVFQQQLLTLVGEYRNSGTACHEHGKLEMDPDELRPPLTVAIVDGAMSFAIDACLEAAIPVVAFRTISACSFWVYNSISDLIQAGELPFPADGGRCNLDEAIRSIPGMKAGLLRRRDLPIHARVKDFKDEPTLLWLHRETRNTSRATALLLNSVEAMESPVLSLIRSEIPHTFAIGPIHMLLQHVRNKPMQSILEASLHHLPPESEGQQSSGSSNHRSSTRMSLWEEDSSCIAWLDEQPSKSVVYVSFGSLTVLTREQILELWHGLLASGQRFLWVLRADAVVESAAGVPPDRDSETNSFAVIDNDHAVIDNDHGHSNDCRCWPRTTFVPPAKNDKQQCQYLFVNWAPQEEVLNHPSVGGFFTHSGWNSTLESLIAGVPMLCLPYFTDQHVNSRFVDHVWKVGIDIKDICDRNTVARAVRSLMQGLNSQKLRAAATELAEAVKAAVAPGGSSYSDFQKLLQCIKFCDFSL